MRNFTVLLLCLLLIQTKADAQFGDAAKEVDNLTHLAKVWGFVKYFHPEVQQCQLDWDNTLITTLENLDGAPQSTYDSIVTNMIDIAGEVPLSNGTPPPIINDDELNNLNLDWMTSDHLSPTVQAKLTEIYDNSRNREHCLLGTAFVNGNLTFGNEEDYASLGTYPNIYYRLLTVFRYWNAIEYFFPYKHIMDQDWNTTLEQFVVPTAYATDAEAFHLKFKELSTYINDSHSFVNSEVYRDWRGRELSPFRAKLVEGESVITAVDTSVSGLEVGDIIRSLDGIPIAQYIADKRIYNAGSNERTIQRNIHSEMIWGPAGNFDIMVEKADGSTQSYALYRNYSDFYNFQVNDSNDPSWTTIELEGCDVGYVNMGLLETSEIAGMRFSLWDKDAIIFDIRNYPNGTMWSMIPYLYDHPIHIASFTTPKPLYAGHFFWHDEILGSNNNNDIYQGKIILLFNEDTQSQAEYTVMGLEQHPGAIKIGSQTAAADGNVSFIDFPGNIRAFFTGLGTYYPDHTPTQRVGIIPDIELTPTIEGIRNGVDEILEFALDCPLIINTSTVDEQVSMQFMPNPFRDYLQVSNSLNQETSLILYDILGNLILETTVQGNETFDVRHLTSGVYFAHWKTMNDATYYTEKLIKH